MSTVELEKPEPPGDDDLDEAELSDDETPDEEESDAVLPPTEG